MSTATREHSTGGGGGAASREYLLDDLEVARFIVYGYHIVELGDIPQIHAKVAEQLDDLHSNPGDAIIDTVAELRQVLDHPKVHGVLTSLLGEQYELNSHRHWHCKEPNTPYMHWHQDSVNTREMGLNKFLGLYYPAEVTADMGPTMIVPATQYRNAPTDRMATYYNIKGQIPLVVKAGTFAITHFDLWHGTAANRSNKRRHMVKFLFNRTRPNTSPTWNHNPDLVERPADWNNKEKAQDVRNILGFTNPLGVSQSDHYKEKGIRRRIWEQLTGEAPS